ncbi:hypothetical protein F0L68_23425 [Solihabitans fulvus]|uniref:RNA polymerase-binding protein RbpA n=1 Tax=Solihabitans fulvus TaxID=1892852 RepID=A0A5B2X6M2_9PSEU|nr:RNA polymerase-binding protein RbpA [Solihabitans fulvus]KAA2258781.1 hypothetical protein F0L68_23425 [Solihabitans fulvus]
MSQSTLRGSRLGAVSRERVDVQSAPRQLVRFVCPKGHDFEVPFAEDAELPDLWACRQHSVDAPRVGIEPVAAHGRVRTHWDMLRERRSIAELEELLVERLYELTVERRQSA